MSLDIVNLTHFLILHTVMMGYIPPQNTPILKTAEKVGDFLYEITVLKSESLLDYFKRIYGHDGPYSMDSCTCVQLASKVLNNTWPYDGGKITIAIDVGDGANYLWNNKIPQMGYITSNNDEVQMLLSVLSSPHRGMWLIQIDEDRFLGLSTQDLVIFSMQKWVETLKMGLKSYYSNQTILDDSIDRFQKEQLSMYEKRGLLENWVFITERK